MSGRDRPGDSPPGVGGDDSRVEGVAVNTARPDAAGELAREEDIGELRDGVLGQARDRSGRLSNGLVVDALLGFVVGLARDVDDARAARGAELRRKESRQKEVAQMVRSEGEPNPSFVAPRCPARPALFRSTWMEHPSPSMRAAHARTDAKSPRSSATNSTSAAPAARIASRTGRVRCSERHASTSEAPRRRASRPSIARCRWSPR